MKTLLIFTLGILTCLILSHTFAKNEESSELVTHTELSSLLFKNCRNVIKFGIPKDANVEYSCSQGRIIKSENTNEITVVPTSDSAVTLTVKYNGKTYKQLYKSVKVPEPTVELRNKDNKLIDLKTGALAPGPDGLRLVVKPNTFFSSIHPADSKYFASEWNIILVRGKRPVAQQRAYKEEIVNLSLIKEHAQPGDRILIEVVKVGRNNFMGANEEIRFDAILNIPLN